MISFTGVGEEAPESCDQQVGPSIGEWGFDRGDEEEVGSNTVHQRAEPLGTIKSVDLDDDTVDIGL